MRRWIIWWALVGIASAALAQVDATLLEGIQDEDKEVIEALVLYPEETREAILQAALSPELLVRIKNLQTRSKEQFNTLMGQYPEDARHSLWDLTRYPDLVSDMVVEDPLTRSELKLILQGYPDVIHERAILVYDDYPDALARMHAMFQESNDTFYDLIDPYDEATQEAYMELVVLPEVLSILTENVELAILAGDLYHKDPQWLLTKAEELHLEVARRQAQELEDWKKDLSDSPELYDQLQGSTEEFAQEHGYDDAYYDPDMDDVYYDTEACEEPRTIAVHHYYHYPYWFGYPSWYVYPRWRPYPYWMEWGFYFRPGFDIVVARMPSYYFMRWYFYHPSHHYFYPRITDHLANYYYGHRRSTSSVCASFDVWKRNNPRVLDDVWLEDQRDRLDKIKAFGKFEVERQNYNAKHPDRPMDQEAFLNKSPRRYPQIKVTPSSDKPPRVVPSGATAQRPVPAKPKADATRPPVRPAKKTIKTDRLKEIQKAKDKHRQTWDKNKKVVTPRAPVKLKKPRTSTKKTTVKKPAVKKSTTSGKATKKTSPPRKKNG